MKRKLLILLLMISILLPTIGQDLRPKPRPVEPIRATVKAPDNEPNNEMASAIKEELRRLPSRDVVITETRADFIIQLNSMWITSGQCGGVVAAVLVVRRSDGVQALSAYAGATPQDVARYIVETTNRENFEPLRTRAISRER